MNKRGQFYLLAAIVIIVLAVAIFSVSNFSKTKEEPRVEELGKQLQLESQKFLEYSAKSGVYDYDQFGKNFSDYVGEDVEIYYYTFNNSGCLNRGFYFNETGGKKVIPTICVYQDYLTAPAHWAPNILYDFRIYKGENFFYIIFQEINGEEYVSTNAEKARVS